MPESKPLTARSSIGSWLDNPDGGPLVRGLLAQSGVGEEALAPIRSLPLQQLVELSQGKLPQSVLDDLVLQANGGVAPTENAEPGVWVEKITDDRFAGRTVIVTGAASGIGRATASRVAREGGRVVAIDISSDRLAALQESLSASDLRILGGDITEQDDIDAVVAAAGGRIDALANVAGVNDDFSPAHETSDQMWDRVIAINLTGPFKLMRAVLPVMLAAGRDRWSTSHPRPVCGAAHPATRTRSPNMGWSG